MTRSNAQQQDEGQYWNGYYSTAAIPELPSQFAVFALNEVQPDMVIDIGCGNGRDSLFFARHGLDVLGIDGSQAAIDLCSQKAASARLDRAKFMCAPVEEENLGERTAAEIGSGRTNILAYSRFFLHAVDDNGQSGLFRAVSRGLQGRKGWLALEFRTPDDRARQKQTPEHYRRYVMPDSVIAEAADHGMTLEYSAEGRGMAKYKSDDAIVARLLFSVGN